MSKRDPRKQRELAARKRRHAARRADSCATTDRVRPAGAQPALEAGAAALRLGHIAEAAAHFQQAIAAEPDHAVAHNCLGIVDRLQGRPADAQQRFQRALVLRPIFPEASNNLGNAYRDLGDDAAAEMAYRRAVELKPDFAEAHNNLGVVYLGREQFLQAIACFERALHIQPAYAEAWNNLGNARRLAGQLAEAHRCFSRALRLNPASAEVNNNLGNVFRELGDLIAARAHYEAALEQQPDLLEAYHNLGSVQIELDDTPGAVNTYRNAVRLRPDMLDHYLYLGDALRLCGETEEARHIYAQAAAQQPGDPLLRLRTVAHCPAVFPNREAAERYREDSLRQWRELADSGFALRDGLSTSRLAEPPFELQFLHGDVRPHREAFAAIYESRFPQRTLPPRPPRPRIGFVVTRGHEGIFLKSMRRLIEELDADGADVVIVCSPGGLASLRETLRRDVQWLPLKRHLGQMQQQLHEAACDVLYYWEVGTDATNYFLPFLRLAPVQCTAWGYQTTSGIGNVDYYLSSRLIEAETAAAHYSEQLLLADTILTYQERFDVSRYRDERERFGVTAQEHLYLAAHQMGKFHPDFDARLAGVLRRDPRGVVVILRDRHGIASRQLEARLQREMPDVVDRIKFLPRQDRSGYLRLVASADLVLDPPHFNGANTSYDAFALGKPVITLPTEYRRGRFTLGLYRKMQHTELVVESEQAYIDLAVELACDVPRRQRLAAELADASRRLFDDRQAIYEFNRLVTQMIRAARDSASAESPRLA